MESSLPARITVLLAVSLTLNLAGLVYVASVIQGRGGIGYLAALLGLSKLKVEKNLVVMNAERQVVYPAPSARPVIFIGDSLTSDLDWREAVGHEYLVLNRGIGGDTSAGVLQRIGPIAALRPAAVFLMIGTNDAQLLGYTPAESAARWRDIIHAVLAVAPDCRIFMQSVLASRGPKFSQWGASLNEELRKLAAAEGHTWVDLRSAMVDSDGLLKVEYTSDGLHLNSAGYRVWLDKVRDLVRRHATRYVPAGSGQQQ